MLICYFWSSTQETTNCSLLSYADYCQQSRRNWPTESLTYKFPGYNIKRLSVHTHMAHREGYSMGGPPLFNVGIWNHWGFCERQTFCPNKELNTGLPGSRPICYSPSYHKLKWHAEHHTFYSACASFTTLWLMTLLWWCRFSFCTLARGHPI